MAYNLLPEPTPFAVDDITTLLLGSLVTLFLTYKKHGRFPWKMIFPLALATFYRRVFAANCDTTPCRLFERAASL